MCLTHTVRNKCQLDHMPKFLNGKSCQLSIHLLGYVTHTYIHNLLSFPQRKFRIKQSSLPSTPLLLLNLHLLLPFNQQLQLFQKLPQNSSQAHLKPPQSHLLHPQFKNSMEASKKTIQVNEQKKKMKTRFMDLSIQL